MTEFRCDVVIAGIQSGTVYSNNNKGGVLQITAIMDFEFNKIQLFWRVLSFSMQVKETTSYLQSGQCHFVRWNIRVTIFFHFFLLFTSSTATRMKSLTSLRRHLMAAREENTQMG